MGLKATARMCAHALATLNLCWPLKWPGAVVECHNLRGRSSMGERLVRNQEAEGSTPFGSTIRRAPGCKAGGDSFVCWAFRLSQMAPVFLLAFQCKHKAGPDRIGP